MVEEEGEEDTQILTRHMTAECRKGLWCKMRHYGVEEKFVKECEKLYSGVRWGL